MPKNKVDNGFIPHTKSPWVVLVKNKKTKVWVIQKMQETKGSDIIFCGVCTRKLARECAGYIRQQGFRARIVRAMIPLR